ncbi:MAG: sugar phosphate isomerase/epimerase family protein [Acutalibacteraceae bacterium]|nr:sugar phosphate isomerase/epimerase family protein [Acutalibacteraceae bacterium]
MLVSASTGGLDVRFGEMGAIKILKDAGLTAFDMSLCRAFEEGNDFYTEENYMAHAKELREYIDGIGLPCNQAHAPFWNSFDGDTNDLRFRQTVISMEVAAILGAKAIVVHPIQHLRYADHAAELFDINVRFYNDLIPYAEKFGIKIATENMYQRNTGSGVPSDSVCSRSWEFCKLIDAVNSPWLVGCLDIGHVSLMGADIPAFIRTMGNGRLCALHIHDTDLVNDNHTIPYLHKINFAPILDALAEIGYKGDITFEANVIYRNFPDELCLSAARLMGDIGHYFADKVQGK